jgi:hypothetical protein
MTKEKQQQSDQQDSAGELEDIKKNIKSETQWFRGVFMLLFCLTLYISGMVLVGVIILQFLIALLTGHDNENLRKFGASLSLYVYQCIRFLTYNDDQKPFPFADWPADNGHVSRKEK